MRALSGDERLTYKGLRYEIGVKEGESDVFLSKIGSDRLEIPSHHQYYDALKELYPTFPGNYSRMLRAHYEATGFMITANELAEAAGYSNFQAANLHYGLLAKRLNEKLCIDLKGTETTFVLAMEGPRTEEKHWQWVMRSEMARAIEHLKLF